MRTFTRRAWIGLLAGAVLAGAAGCDGTDPDGKGGEHIMSITFESSAFADGQAIPARYTHDGKDVSPPLAWSNVPPAAVQLALIVDDPDAPVGTWDHWIVYKIPADRSDLPEGTGAAGRHVPTPLVEGRNSWGNAAWGGPAPPPGKPHHYHFKLYALDAPMDLPAGATKAQLEKAMNGHIIGKGELVGTYKR